MNMKCRLKKVRIVLFVVLSTVLAFSPASAYTPEETNEVVRTLLASCNRLTDNLEDLPETVLDTSNPYVFFNKIDVGGGWTPEGKRAAFSSFLEEMGSFDFSGKDRRHIYTAVLALGQYRRMNYTNALPAIRRLALNPTFPSEPSWRWDAIKMVIEQTGPTEDCLHFVETILTNKTVFTLSERGCACGLYVHSLLTNTVNSAVLTNVVSELYSVRKQGVAGGYMLDKLFVKNIGGFEFSSNRLDYAEFVLSSPECDEYDRRDFTEITNRLHSSEHPLRQLTIGEGENE